ncbi:hypothetical protein AB205_0162590, partial [Aquarana catesbeiana]
MTDPVFHRFLALLTPYISRQDTCMRQAITPEQRLVATLRYLATGKSLQDLKFSTGISPQALGIIIPETYSAIIQILQKEYIKFPSNPQEWQTVASHFAQRWDFANCGGAIDGKHFLYVDVGKNGWMSDGGVIAQTEFYRRLQNGSLDLSPPEDNVEGLPFVFVADEAFVLGDHLAAIPDEDPHPGPEGF